jgi:Na+-translocating ferredoxin:NAD+ oxidoreductase RnfC subunit
MIPCLNKDKSFVFDSHATQHPQCPNCARMADEIVRLQNHCNRLFDMLTSQLEAERQERREAAERHTQREAAERQERREAAERQERREAAERQERIEQRRMYVQAQRDAAARELYWSLAEQNAAEREGSRLEHADMRAQFTSNI